MPKQKRNEHKRDLTYKLHNINGIDRYRIISISRIVQKPLKPVTKIVILRQNREIFFTYLARRKEGTKRG
mgnify:FL=1